MTGTYPPAIQRRIKAGASDPQIIPVGVVLHVAASVTRSLFPWFNGPSGGIESHLYIRKSGVVEQYRSLNWEADAQFRGNSWIGLDGKRYGFLSVETAGLGPGMWNDAQLESIKAFLSWSSTEFGFPLQPVRAERPGAVSEGGVSYHTRFAGWSNVTGKTCPGPQRIKQFHDVIRPWMRDQRTPCLHCPWHCPKP